MVIPEELTKLISTVNSGMIWLYSGIFLVLMYLIVSLLTWSFIKPLKYLGIPTCIVGILFIVIRFIPGVFISALDIKTNVINAVLPSILKPILINGILCLFIGIAMIVIYSIIDKKIVKIKQY